MGNFKSKPQVNVVQQPTPVQPPAVSNFDTFWTTLTTPPPTQTPTQTPTEQPWQPPTKKWADGRIMPPDLPWIGGKPSLSDPNYYFQYSPEIRKITYTGSLAMSDAETRKLDDKRIALDCLAEKPTSALPGLRSITCGINYRVPYSPSKGMDELAEGEAIGGSVMKAILFILLLVVFIYIASRRMRSGPSSGGSSETTRRSFYER